MDEKVLLVDDDSNVLNGYRRSLGREFHLETAIGGEQALKLVSDNGAYAVIVADMKMPGMDGIQLLSKVRVASPNTVRVMLTGNADTESAIEAINEGAIFRFLTKPCGKELMGKTLTAALIQYRLVTAESNLLEQTLSGCIQVLTEVLSLVNPAAFSRAERACRYIRHVTTVMKLNNPWQYEVAAMMSQLGCVTLPPETIESVYKGEELSANEQALYDAHPGVASGLLSKIPRLEPIAWMIEHQNEATPPEVDPDMEDVRMGAQILRLVLAYEKLIHRGKSRTEAVHTLALQNKDFNKSFFDALVMLDPNAEEGKIQKCRIEMLTPEMIIQSEMRTADGTLIASKGQEVTAALIIKLKNLAARRAIMGEVTISLPQRPQAFKTGAS
ncbi:MAG TPA: HD domain-containing phosphohydrolase [Candidatus Binatia bacterium]|nr:HD domain-containing phosphohydrolase [Candidatus Binatia bacterium]